MDSYETLLEKGQYELIIKATHGLKEPEALFYRIIAFSSILKFNEALEVLTSNRHILEEANMKLCVQLHIDILILLGEFDLAFEEFAYYKERPYVSQEVEELLKTLPKYIREKEKESYIAPKKEINDEQINTILRKGTTEEIIPILDLLKNKDLNPFIDNIVNLIKEHPSQPIRTFALLLLVSTKYNKDIIFKSNEGLLTLNPSKLIAPFNDNDFVLATSYFYEDEKNITLADSANQLFSSLLIMIYPKNIRSDDILSLAAIKELARKYLQQENEIEKTCLKYNLNYNELKTKIDEFEDILSRF